MLIKTFNNKDLVPASIEGVPDNIGEVKVECHSEVIHVSPEAAIYNNHYANVEYKSVVKLESTQDTQISALETVVSV